MDAQSFDRLIADAARRPNRRTAIRLLAGGLFGGWLASRGLTPAQAQRLDSDNDGLFDDDETGVYGTLPNNPDTDGDGSDDGQEVYDGTDPLVNPNAAPPPVDPAPPAAACLPLGASCYGREIGCCDNNEADGLNQIQCCPDGIGGGYCMDLGDRFICPDPGVPASGCAVGQTNCGGFCTDVSIDHGNCGACGNSCGLGYNCVGGTCTYYCPTGTTTCGESCVDLSTNRDHCGSCFEHCPEGLVCQVGLCGCDTFLCL